MPDFDPDAFKRAMSEVGATPSAPATDPTAAPAVPFDPEAFRTAMGTVQPPQQPIPTVEPSLSRPIDMVTGGDRTEFPERRELTPGDVRSANGSGNPLAAIFTDPKYRQVLLGYVTAPSPEAQRDVLKSGLGLPDSAFSQDRFGNWMVEFGGTSYYVNKPGFSSTEGLQLGRDAIAASVLRGRSLPSSTGASAMAQQVLSGGALNAGASVGYDVASRAAGSEQDIDPVRAVIAGALGGGAEALVPAAQRIAGLFRGEARVAPRLIGQYFDQGTDTLTPEGRTLLEKAGVKPDDFQPVDQLRILNSALLATQQPVLGAVRASRPPTEATVQRAATAVRAEESGIPRTAGQASGSQRALDAEQTLRETPGAASRTMREFDTRQTEAANTAIERARQTALGTPLPRRTETEVGDVVGDGLRAQQRQSNAAVNTAYAAIPAPEQFSFAADRGADLTARMTTAAESTLVTPGSKVEAAQRAVEAMTAGDTPITLKQVETLRRQLGNAIDGAAGDDRTALIRMKSALDGWIDTAMADGAYAGAPETVTALKAARAEATRHAQDWSPTGVAPGVRTALKRVIDQGASGSEVGDAVFGRGTEFGSTATRQTVEHVLRVTGGDPAITAGLREAAVNRLLLGAKISDRQSLASVADRLDEALTDRGSPVMARLFSAEELAGLRRLSTELRQVASARGDASGNAAATITGSGLGAVLGEAVGRSLGLPWIGGTVGAAAGAALPRATAGSAARAATEGVSMHPPVDWSALVGRQQAGALAREAAGKLPRSLPQGLTGLLMPDAQDAAPGLFPPASPPTRLSR